GDIFNPFNYFTCNIGWDPNFIQFHSDFITWPTFSFTDLSFDLGCVDFGTIAGIFDVGTLCAGSVDVGNVIPTFSGGSIGSPLTISGPPITGLSNPFSINHTYIDNIAAQLRLIPYKSKAAGIIANPLNAAVNFGSAFLGGVTFESGAGDYAEWLERADHNEKLTIGDVVAVVNGKITKNTTGASQLMVVSWKPCVLGNTPEVGKEQFYNKVAFMGQIPVKMFCAVKKGDYIVPDGNNNGFAKAISPSELTSDNFNAVLGVAWEDAPLGIKFVKVVVGLRPNEMASVIQDQAKKIENLRAKALELDKLNAEVSEIESAIKPASVLKTAARKTTASKKKQLSSN
ncbi:MAG TPA: hypothetical protein VFO76_05435, partial [Candidatus Kapabacteria bacterium]|nr:hypothetical protein [Candidatus Kapabacteria bacterium]